MNGDDVEVRFLQALAASSPADALLALARSLKSEGMSQRELYDLFNSHQTIHSEDADETLYDAILDTMDHIVGYCAPSARLFDEPFIP